MKDIQKKNSLNKKSKSKKRVTFHAVGMLAVSCCMAAPVMAESIVSETQTFVLAEQSHKVSGIVLDETGEPLIGVSVLIEGTSSGTITDFDGKFILDVQPKSTLVISYVGYQTQKIQVGNQKSLTVKMKSDNELLDEVVVIGYQTIKRKDLTGSVASVKGESIAAMPVSNIAQAMQGKLPGVNITSQDGRPDAEVSIRVRGGGSISQSNEPLILVDGIAVGSLSDIPSDQVESIDVLKDASSTAIYGARGANGVILVTTKGAKEGKVSVTYNGYVKFNTPTKYLEALSPYDYLSFVWANAAASGDAYREPFEKLFGLGANRGNNTNGIESYRNMAADDIQREVYNSSVSHNHDVTITGGTDKTKVLFALNYMDEQGMKINSFSKRAGASLKVNQKLADNVVVSLDTRFSDIRNMGDEGTTNGSGSLLSSAYRFRPISTQHILGNLDALREGNVEQFGRASLWDAYSPVSKISDYEPLEINQNLRSTLSLDWELFKNLKYHTDLTYSNSWNQDKIWAGAVYNEYLDDSTGEKLYAGSVDYRKDDSWNLRWTNTMSYDFTLPEAHRLNLLVGHEVTDSGGSELRVKASHFPSNFTKDNAFAMINQYDKDHGTSSFSSNIDTASRILSFFGRVNYSLLDRYLLTVTFRADGSSKFSPEHRWGYFPAAAFGWRLSEEAFMKDIDWLDNLKLRLSYGTVGNDGINSDLWSQMWTSETDLRWQYAMGNNYWSSYDYATSEMANQDLKWETTITRNVGLDFGFFKNRLWGSVDLYWNTTKDLLMLTSIPGITGFTSTYANIGQTSNKGLELSLSGVLFENKDWSITAGMNINFNRGNVDELADNVSGLYGTSWASSSTFPTNDYILKEGSPVGIVRGFICDGFYTTDDFDYIDGKYVLKEGIPDLGSFINPVHVEGRPEGQNAYPGLPKFRNMDDDDTVIDERDVTEIGDMNPVHTGGFNINATYKNFDLGMYFNWSYGNEIYNVNKLASMYCAKESGVYQNKLAFMKDAYKVYDIVDGELVRLTTPEQLNAANVNAKYPLPYCENGVTSTLGIEDGSYLRLNTLTLGYSLPDKALKKIGLDKLRIYGSVYNLFTITGYSGLDPEVSANTSQNNARYPTTGLDWGSYPRARSFVVGLNLAF